MMTIHPINDLADTVERAPFRIGPIILLILPFILVTVHIASINTKQK